MRRGVQVERIPDSLRIVGADEWGYRKADGWAGSKQSQSASIEFMDRVHNFSFTGDDLLLSEIEVNKTESCHFELKAMYPKQNLKAALFSEIYMVHALCNYSYSQKHHTALYPNMISAYKRFITLKAIHF